jgi:hypothetical protein
MKRLLRALAMLFAGVCLAGTAIPQTPTAAPANDSLEKLATEFWSWRGQTQPFSSDDIPRIERLGGIRTWSRAEIEKQRTALAGFESRWKKLASAAIVKPQQVDYRLMGSALARVHWELDINARWKRDPNFYIEQTLTALAEALLVPPPFDQDRSRELLTRIRNIPAIVKEGEMNLENPPAPFATAAIEALDGVQVKLGEMVKSLAAVTELEPDELSEALETAGKALEQYRDWLQKKLPGLPLTTALGRQAYVFFLNSVALIPYSPENLLEMSNQEWARSVAFEAYEENRNRDVPPLPLFPDIDTWIGRTATDENSIRQFLASRGILSVPQTVAHYTLRPMPDYLRAVSAFTETDDFTGPSRLNEDGVRYVEPPSQKLAFFWLAAAHDTRPETVHEGVPGHYLQLAISWRNPDPIRRHFYDSGANEGIGFYAEEMMLQAGLFDDSPHTREIIYHFMRLRALRVEVDVKLALGEFTLQQAAEYLESRVPMDRQTARSEAIAFSTAPGQAISYQVGKMQILQFLADARRLQGDKFNLRQFHDSLWSNGNVPIALQRSESLGLN